MKLDKYKILVEIGTGGMADVFLAVTEGPAGSGFSKLHVVKRLRKGLDEPEYVNMLLDEARIAARLNHANIVQTNEIGRSDDQFFIAMEFLNGQPLSNVLRRAQKTKATIPNVYVYLALADVLAGLHYAHTLTDYDGQALGIVHRDVSPQNVFVTYDGQVKVLDFGIAKAAGRLSQTETGVMKGKLRYMGPEQARGSANVDARADVFAVGVMLWEAATGQRFWGERDEIAILTSLLDGTYAVSPRSVAPDVPEEIDSICRRALARERDDRYPSASAMQRDLEAFVAREQGALTDARRSFGDLVSAMFATERQQLHLLIKERLTLANDEELADPAINTVRPHSLSPSAAKRLFADESSGHMTALGPATEPSNPNASSIRHGGRRMWAAPVVGLALAAIGGGFFASRANTQTVTRGDPSSSGPTASTSVSASQPDDPPVVTIAVSLTATPANATLRVDDGPVLANPFEGRMPRDGRTHVIEARVDERVERRSVVFSDDVVVDIDLSLAAAPSSSAAPKPGHAGTPTARPTEVRPRPTTSSSSSPKNPPASSASSKPTPQASSRFEVDPNNPYAH